jgi:hypothetical protein
MVVIVTSHDGDRWCQPHSLLSLDVIDILLEPQLVTVDQLDPEIYEPPTLRPFPPTLSQQLDETPHTPLTSRDYRGWTRVHPGEYPWMMY